MYCLQNKIHLKLCCTLVLLNTAFNPASLFAAEPQTVDIQANYLLLDENKGISTYKGNVLFKKGTLVIKADNMTLYSNGDSLEKVLITGSPADVQHAPDNEEKVHSQARQMEYLVTEDKLTLTGKAFVNQGNQHFSGESIEYDTRQRIISASANHSVINKPEETTNAASTNQRVHVIIGPDSNNNDAKSNDSDN